MAHIKATPHIVPPPSDPAPKGWAPPGYRAEEYPTGSGLECKACDLYGNGCPGTSCVPGGVFRAALEIGFCSSCVRLDNTEVVYKRDAPAPAPTPNPEALKPGDHVTVMRRAESYEGWPFSWHPVMDRSVGKSLTVRETNDYNPDCVRLSDGYWYPAFVLAKLVPPAEKMFETPAQPAQPKTNKEIPMDEILIIEQRTYVNGIDIASLPVSTVVNKIAAATKAIDELEKLAVKPRVIVDDIAKRREGLAALVAALDAEYAKKNPATAAAPSA
jgi:hypothetical protein